MRPDETCKGCVLSYRITIQWKCQLIDKLVFLKNTFAERTEIIEWLESKEAQLSTQTKRTGLDFLEWFWSACITLEEITSLKAFNSGCINCGACCKGHIYQLPKWSINRLDPKSGMDSFMCKYLEYHEEFHNGTNDLGWRCAIFGKNERPEICKKFPSGKETVCIGIWLQDYLEITNTSLPLCPAKWKIITEGLA